MAVKKKTYGFELKLYGGLLKSTGQSINVGATRFGYDSLNDAIEGSNQALIEKLIEMEIVEGKYAYKRDCYYCSDGDSDEVDVESFVGIVVWDSNKKEVHTEVL